MTDAVLHSPAERRRARFGTPRPQARHSLARHALPLFLLALLLAAPALAQYRDAGSGLDLLPNRKQQLEQAMDKAPWRLGKVRVSPWIGLRDISYVRELDQNGNERESDLTITGGAGLRAYLKLGSNAIAAAHALPEYAWWQRQEDRGTAVGHYGLGLFGWGSRVQGEITARRNEEVRFLSSDLLLREPTRSDELAASAQVRLFGSIAVFGAATSTRTRIEATSDLAPIDPALLLDRDSSTARAGLRYLLRGERGHLGAGALREQTEFLAADGVRSNEGSSWYAEMSLRGNRLDATAQYEQRDLEADDSAFPGYTAGNGQASLVFKPGWRVRYQLYGLRGLRYSGLSLGSYVEEQRVGAAVRTAIGDGGVTLFYEDGDDDYFGTTARHESVTARGVTLDFAVRALNVRIGGRETEFEPAGGGTPREVREVLGSVSLSFGGGSGDW